MRTFQVDVIPESVTPRLLYLGYGIPSCVEEKPGAYREGGLADKVCVLGLGIRSGERGGVVHKRGDRRIWESV